MSHPLSRSRRLLRLLVTAVAAVSASLALASPAAAALPDRFGFVLWNGVAPVASGTWPAATTVAAGPVGRYTVVFPGQAASGGVVHVTAINASPHWCQVDSWSPVGADEVVKVSCYKIGGVLDPTPFSAVFHRSSGAATTSAGRFAYVDAQASGAIVSQYNSAGAANAVTHLAAVGQWEVRLPGIGTAGPVAGSVQVTAVNPAAGARCKVASWSSAPAEHKVRVNCFSSAGAPLDVRFTLTFQYQRSLYGGFNPPKQFGYLWNTPPVGPVPTNHNSIAGPGTNTLISSGIGLSLVRFPGLTFLPDTVQVTAAGAGANFCGLQSAWTHSATETVVRNVNCFTSAGAAASTGFLVSANSAF